MQFAMRHRGGSVVRGATGSVGAGLAVVLIVALAFARGGSGGSSVGSGQTGAGATVPTPAIASATPSPSPRPGAIATPEPTPTPTCNVTHPGKPFVPPKPYPATPPGYDGATWYGSAHLWTMIKDGGEIWGPWLFASPPGLPQKTFWWSADWVFRDELKPSISVVGKRLDAPGSFSYGNPGTNATADFGTAMLVGIDIPTYGCWELTARYREASLSYVVNVINP